MSDQAIDLLTAALTARAEAAEAQLAGDKAVWLETLETHAYEKRKLVERAEAAEAWVRVAQDRERQNAELLDRERGVTARLSDQLASLEAEVTRLTAAIEQAEDAMTYWKDGTLVWCACCATDEAIKGHAVDCSVAVLAALLPEATNE